MFRFKIMSLAMLSLFGFQASAQSDWSFGQNFLYTSKMNSFSDDESLGAAVEVGYSLSPTWHIEAGGVYFGKLENEMASFDDHRGIDLSVVRTLKLSPEYSFYLGVGVLWQQSNIQPTSQLGIRYRLNDRWDVDAGYRFTYLSERNYDLQSLSLGLRYRFGKSEQPVPIQQEEPSEPPLSTIPVSEESQCITSFYVIQPGDWLSKIAIKYNVSFEYLSTLNKGFGKFSNIDLIFPGQTILVPISGCFSLS
ncbi:outer membrane beta-barrel protein [Vibrio vulnificus]|uniref:outer membrane beta-barrel protein n=1 Tax=Vibrio vulnificus TaxID=672 RepID=UPI001EEB984D|nr:outer membrane beta-barrel protein [Vibrio vulnificus]MCG6303595.1 outer membrane beta-barrel protein [Vibrio vulnificus]